ncbi:MAG: DNA/RNA nuclease SfsA [Bdellovibrionales bacterium]|nr:DNA/RNA nuclease SfsA [Bdellovibrionales bacterium]
MQFDQPLREGRFIKRYKRFFVDIDYQGETLTAHCPNTGSMMGCKDPESPVLFSSTDDPNRKLKHTLQMVKAPKSWVGVNTALPNKLVRELFETQPLKHWQKFDRQQGEVKINEQSRMDMVLWDSKAHEIEKWSAKNIVPPLHFIEVKNVTLEKQSQALFPDAVSTRGQKHLQELMDLVDEGYSCEMVFVVQRQDCKAFAPADEIDPEYGKLLRKAHSHGVKVTPLVCEMSPQEIRLTNRPLPLNL